MPCAMVLPFGFLDLPAYLDVLPKNLILESDVSPQVHYDTFITVRNFFPCTCFHVLKALAA